MVLSYYLCGYDIKCGDKKLVTQKYQRVEHVQ